MTPRHAAALKGRADWSPPRPLPWRGWASGHQQGRKSVARPESDSDKSPCMPDARAEREGEILWRFSEIDMLSYVCLYHTYTLLRIRKIDDRFKLKIDIRYFMYKILQKKYYKMFRFMKLKRSIKYVSDKIYLFRERIKLIILNFNYGHFSMS